MEKTLSQLLSDELELTHWLDFVEKEYAKNIGSEDQTCDTDTLQDLIASIKKAIKEVRRDIKSREED